VILYYSQLDRFIGDRFALLIIRLLLYYW